MYLGGSFTQINGTTPSGRFARWGCPIAPDGDADGDGVITLLDYAAFYECLIASGPAGRSAFGCVFSDLDADQDTDLRDFASFAAMF